MKSVSLGLVVLAVLCMMSLAFSDFIVRPAYADVVLTTVDPTGDGLGAGADCNLIAGTSDVVFMGCNTILLAYDALTHVELANLTISTLSNTDFMLASNTGTCVYINDNNVMVERYCYVDGTPDVIQKTGQYDPGGCTPSSMSYDDNGYLWLTCGSEDLIIRFNPVTMTNYLTSPDLTDGVGVDCDSPGLVTYSYHIDKGVIHCAASNTYVTFESGGLFTVALLDSEPDGTSEDSLVLDGFNHRFWVARSTGLWYYNFDSTTGVITATGTNIVASSYTDCYGQQLLGQNIFVVCHGNTFVDAFLSNASPSQVFNAVPVTTVPAGVTFVRWATGSNTWYLSTGTDNQEWLELTGLEGDVSNPPPAGGGSDGDIDGDGIPNHEDDDIDGDGIANDADDDIDGDGIPNDEDDTRNGPVGDCDEGFIAIDFSGDGTNVICVPLGDDGSADCSGFACNPLVGDNTPGIGIPSIIAIWGFTETQANIMATILLFLISFVIVVVPAWRFGYDPSPLMMFVLIMLDLSLAVVLGWVDSLYFFAVIAAIAVGGGLKFSGVL